MRLYECILVVASLSAIACTSTEPARHDAARPPTAANTPGPAAPIVPQPAQKETRALPLVPVVPQGSKAATSQAPTTATAETRAERFATIQKELDAAMNAYYDLFRSAKTEEESKKVAETAKEPDTKPFLARARVLLDEDARDAVALDVILWMLDWSRTGADEDDLLGKIEAAHLQSEKLGDSCRMLVDRGSPKGAAIVERLLKDSPHKSVRANACYALAQSDLESVRSALRLQGEMSAEDVANWKKYRGEEKYERLKKLDVAATQKHAEALLERVVKEFADVPYYKSTLGESAQGDLYEMRMLALGKTAPDIAGEDLSATAFKLSDYRGKVVMLDFWGNW